MRTAHEDARRHRDHYPRRETVASRFTDVDAFGHLNNVAVAQYFEEARARLSRELFGVEAMRGETSTALLVASVQLQYLSPAGWPDELCVGVGVVHIGRSSWTCGYGLFAGDSCVALSDATLVHTVGGTPTALPDTTRSELERLQLEP